MTAHLVQCVAAEGLCMGCGFCAASASKGRIVLGYDVGADQFLPKLEGWTPADGEDTDVLCPGAGVDMRALSLQVHGRLPDDAVLGVCESVRVCHATDEALRGRAASGGVVPTVLRHLFAERRIDAAYCLVPGDGPLEAKGRILRSAGELDRIHGSVYHPFDYGHELRELVEGGERFALVGLPCQIAGLEMLKARRPELVERHVFSIGLFCGGVNRLEGIAWYLRAFGIRWGDVASIDYRHGDWPGRIRVRLVSAGEERTIPRIQGNTRWRILRYMAAMQGPWMLKRCRLCPDPIADFSDVAVGDPHVPEYRNRKSAGFSLMLTRTPRGEALVRDLVDAGALQGTDAGREIVIASQGYTLDNRRHAAAYVRVARRLRMSVPSLTVYDGLEGGAFRHYKYALVDLVKLRLRRLRFLRPLFVFLQAFEYLFITLYPSLFFRRLKRLLLNRGRP